MGWNAASSELPDEYKPMIMALENSGSAITADLVKMKILQKVKSKERPAALYTHKQNPRQKDKRSRCYKCNEYEYFANKCATKNQLKGKKSTTQNASSSKNKTGKNKSEGGPTTKAKKERPFAHSTSYGLASILWYVDTCAFTHGRKCDRRTCLFPLRAKE